MNTIQVGLISLTFFLLISMQTAEHRGLKKNNAELICGDWILAKITSSSEKTIYESNLTDFFTLNCDPQTWTKTAEGEMIANGTWSLEDSELELRVGNHLQKGQVNLLNENHLTITFSGITYEYVRG